MRAGHGVSLAEIEALFAGDVYVVRDTVVNGDRRLPGTQQIERAWIFCGFTWQGVKIRTVRFELARKDASISLRLPAALLATLKASAAKSNMPTQRLLRMMIDGSHKTGLRKVSP